MMDGEGAANVRKTKRQEDDTGRVAVGETGLKRRAALSTLTNQKLAVSQPEAQKVFIDVKQCSNAQIPVALLPVKRVKSDACTAPVLPGGWVEKHYRSRILDSRLQLDRTAPKELEAPSLFSFGVAAPSLPASMTGSF